MPTMKRHGIKREERAKHNGDIGVSRVAVRGSVLVSPRSFPSSYKRVSRIWIFSLCLGDLDGGAGRRSEDL